MKICTHSDDPQAGHSLHWTTAVHRDISGLTRPPDHTGSIALNSGGCHLTIEIDPKRVLKVLLWVILVLFVAHTAVTVSRFYSGPVKGYLIPLFDFGNEANIPTFYASLMLVLCSILLAAIAATHRRLGSPYLLWSGLAVIFVFLSIDEIAALHERIIEPVRQLTGASGVLYYAWIIPYGIALVVFVLVYARFLARLPRTIMLLFIAAGAIYVAGAIGFELLEGRKHELLGDAHYARDIRYVIYHTVEELLEMIGLAVFVYALLRYITTRFGALTISTKKAPLR